ncbi:radical SAM protein [Actinoallomurus purpureus]|uniref:radical SAM protein n=1 Tax=Actinoallomurus purpureus TaxID=478114 RepID=UPI0020936A62|nr:radical SAM protein [Actinoallomurus purpureus]MCO6005801.1 radical SAM protein [Actinoallomurus purpureus]
MSKGESRHPLALAEEALPIRWVFDPGLRPKFLDTCGFTCVFCHNEGTPVTSDQVPGTPITAGPGNQSQRVSIYAEKNGVDFLADRMRPDEEFVRVITLLRDKCGLTEMHGTGGEPTLHPQLHELIALANGAGYRNIGVTSNGENGALALPKAARAGLRKVNFSIFGTTAEELAEVQAEKFGRLKLAEKKIVALQRSIEAALESDLKVSANIVVPDESHIERVRHLIEKYGRRVEIRLLRSIAEPASANAIWTLLDSLGATPVERVDAWNVSGGYKVTYALPDGGTVGLKQIRPVFLPETCGKCPLAPWNGGGCDEGYYGLRLYKAVGGPYMVGVCIQRMDLTMTVDEFVESELCAEVMRRERRRADTLS